MGPKVKFQKEEIVEAAFELVKERGFKELTAIKVAQKLNSSVQPIYFNLNSMNDLKREVVIRGRDLMREYARKDYGETLFINFAIGDVLFTLDHSNLYSAFFIEKHEHFDIIQDFNSEQFEMLRNDELFSNVDHNTLVRFFTQIVIYVTGILTLICRGAFTKFSRENVIQIVKDGGFAIYKELIKSGNYENLDTVYGLKPK